MTQHSYKTIDYDSIDPHTVYSYLEENGWLEARKIDDRATILTTHKNDKQYSILLPLDKDIPDFASRMYDVLKTLEFIEARPRTEIIKALKSTKDIAFEKNCEILSLRLKSIDQPNKYELSAKKMGLLLTSTQDLFDAVGQSEKGYESNKGKIPQEILEQTELNVFNTFKGSFGIQLALAPKIEQLNLLEQPLSERVADIFLELVKLSNEIEKEELKHLLLKIKRRASARYRKFLSSLIRSESDLYLDWGSVNPDAGGNAFLSYDSIIKTVDFINKMEVEDPEEYQVIGELLSASNTKKRKALEIEELKSNKIFSGKISESLLDNQNIELTLGKIYSVNFQETTSINPATGEEKIERTAISISTIEQNQS
jgi:hypothetical protein